MGRLGKVIRIIGGIIMIAVAFMVLRDQNTNQIPVPASTQQVSATKLWPCTDGSAMCRKGNEVMVNYHTGNECSWTEQSVDVDHQHAVTNYQIVQIDGVSFPNWATIVIGTPNQEFYINGVKGFHITIHTPNTCTLDTAVRFAQQWGLLVPDELRALKILSGPTINP